MKKSHLFLGAVLSFSGVALSNQNAHVAPMASRAVARSWVALKTTTDFARYTPGQPIHVSLIAHNWSSHGAYLRFSSGQRFDFSVYQVGQSETAYTWSASRMFPQMVGLLWLKPGQSQIFDAEIGDEMGQLKPGKYRLVSHLTNSPHNIVAAPVAFEIVNPGLAMTARTDKSVYKVGEPVQIDVNVGNLRSGPNRVHFNSGLGCDVIISDEAGRQVWTYGANLRFIRALGGVTWQKNEIKIYGANWNGVALPGNDGTAKIEPGRYKVQAVLQSTPLVYAAPLYIEITG